MSWRDRADARIGRCPDCDGYTFDGVCRAELRAAVDQAAAAALGRPIDADVFTGQAS